MALISYDEAVAAELVAYLQAGLDAALGAGVVPVVNGYPDDQEEQPTGPAFLSVSMGKPDETPTVGTDVSATTAEGIVTTLVSTAHWSLTMQVDLFVTQKRLRAELDPVIRKILAPSSEHPKFALTLTDYHGFVAVLGVESVGNEDDDAAMQTREWQRSWMLQATGRALVPHEAPELTDLRSAVSVATVISTS